MVNKTRLSKFMSYILRHNPKKFGLELDNQGFVNLDKFLNVVNKRIPGASIYSIIDIVNNSTKMGIKFFSCGDVFLAESIPSEFIE